MRVIRLGLFLFTVSILFSGCHEILDPDPGLYINEFLASNSGTNVDPMNQEEVDWIELFNAYDSAVDLSDFYLTDNLKDTAKWTFPKGTIIDAKCYLIIWADGQDTALHTNFKLSKSGEEIALFSKDKELLDMVEYKAQDVNISYGRKWDGFEDWTYFNEPTPYFSNSKHKGTNKILYSAEPEFSEVAGNYNQELIISISSPVKNAEIWYTLNGDKPTKDSRLYSEPFEINKTSVIRAISVERGKLPSGIITRTYFINVDKDMLVVSLVADSDALWDTSSGIYQNSIKNVSRMANVEVFEGQKQLINQAVNLSVSGNIARFHGQKAILVEASERYGKATLDYRFFPNKRIYSFQSILFRAGGHPDKYNSMFTDGLGHYLTEEHLDVDHIAYRPCVVYLNGKYWGIYNVREKLNANYLVDNHNLDKNKFDLLETAWATPKNGDASRYRRNLKFIRECDKSNPNNYAYVKTLIDVDNYIDYNICELYAANLDWPSWNIKFWRERKEGALWKWVLTDLDYGFGTGAKVDSNMIAYATSPVKTRATNPPIATELLRKMLEFPEFKNEFIQRFAASLNVIYSSERVLKIIEQFKEERAKEMPLHIERWKDSVYHSPWAKFKIPQSMVKWEDKVEVMRDFARRRPGFIRENLTEKFDLNGMVTITTNSNGGFITMNSIKLGEGKHLGSYFKGIPVRMEAIPNPGQKFLYWLVDGRKDYSSTIKLVPESDKTIEAIFKTAHQTALPRTIDKDTTLKTANSPYYATGDIFIKNGATLTIEKGVQILMEQYKSIVVYGGLKCNGTMDKPVLIMPNPYTKTSEWGALCFDNAADIELNHLKITGGTWYEDKTKYKATITSFNSKITLNHVLVESSYFPFYSEYGVVSISNSKMVSPITCDLINIKYAKSAIVENCDLQGNDYPDTDAIDYDGISDGVIRNNRIYGFFGFNSDAIDIGEASSDVLVESNLIFNMSDKGVSVGQGSNATIKNNLFYGCNMAIGIKDSNSFAYVDRNTFYGNKYGVAVFEKNKNSGGGGAEVMNCIFYQSRKKPILIDNKSWVSTVNSISNKKQLNGRNNIFGDPEFVDIINFNFNLNYYSPALSSGIDDRPDMGAKINIPKERTPEIIINEINLSPVRNNDPQYWIELYNNSGQDVDLTGWTITNENHFIYPFPQNFILKKNEFLVLSNDLNDFLWHYPNVDNVRSVLENKLIERGNTLLLYDAKMNLVDDIDYKNLLLWPDKLSKIGASIILKSTSLDTSENSSWHVDAFEKGSPGSKNP